MQQHPVQFVAQRAQRWSVGAGQCHPSPVLAIVGELDIGVEGGEQPAARPGRLPPQGYRHLAVSVYRAGEPDSHQPRRTRHRPGWADPQQVLYAAVVDALGQAV